MSGFNEIAPERFDVSPFRAIGTEWMLIAAEKAGRVNAMTASWGGLGVMWRKNVVFAVIRPQRFTKEFVDGSDTFSLNFLGPDRKNDLSYFGSVSGRDEDKIARTGLTVVHDAGAPYFAEAGTAILCRKLFAQPYEERSFIDPKIAKELYAAGDFHTLYIGEVLKILARKEK
jgi:flavin reductase (DIM6/NTAB) family NADH-FMN oxidoreductase RutF